MKKSQAERELTPRNQFGEILPPDARDRDLLWLLAWCAVALMAAEYLLIPLRTSRLLSGFDERFATSALWTAPLFRSVIPQLWWAVGMLVLWVAVPHRLFRRAQLTPFSIGLPSTKRGVAIYAAMIAVMIPLLIIASARPDFLRMYPMVRPVAGYTLGWALLLSFWACYITILFCTEYFFRGAMLFALEPKLGTLAIAVCVMPYALVHVHKPAPEAFASIIAGYLLGYLALTTRSIGGGVVVHCAVALGMDVLALTRNGAFPTHW